jgi:hypothetical protein
MMGRTRMTIESASIAVIAAITGTQISGCPAGAWQQIASKTSLKTFPLHPSRTADWDPG